MDPDKSFHSLLSQKEVNNEFFSDAEIKPKKKVKTGNAKISKRMSVYYPENQTQMVPSEQNMKPQATP